MSFPFAKKCFMYLLLQMKKEILMHHFSFRNHGSLQESLLTASQSPNRFPGLLDRNPMATLKK
jgi:hypothetical protein